MSQKTKYRIEKFLIVIFLSIVTILLLLGWDLYLKNHEFFDGYGVNIYIEAIELILTVIVLGGLSQLQRNRREKMRLVLRMGSSENSVAIEAVRMLREYGWLDDLRDINLTRANLKNADFFMANLRNSNLSNVNLCDAYLGFADLRDVNFFNANLQNVNFEYADLRGANFSKANLTGATMPNGFICQKLNDFNTFINADSSRPRIVRQFMADSRHNSYFRGLHFKGENLRNADLRQLNLRGAYLRNADLRKAQLEKCSLRGANLSGANLMGIPTSIAKTVDVLYARYDRKTTFPNGQKYEKAPNDVWIISAKTLYDFEQQMRHIRLQK